MRRGCDGASSRDVASAGRQCSTLQVLRIVCLAARVERDAAVAFTASFQHTAPSPVVKGELSQARNDGIDIERASATWSTSSFTSYHGQLLSLAVQWGVAIEIERAIKKSARFC